jgi:curved DNA-binding protein CbpA
MVNPFDALGLPATTALTDAEVRDAWRAAAAATHPDQGGDPAAYAAAAAAYAQLRTGWGRSEALADLAARPQLSDARSREPQVSTGIPAAWQAVALLPARARHGRPGRLAARTLIAVTAAVIAVTLTAGTASAPATAAGCLLWWACTARGDLAPPPGR